MRTALTPQRDLWAIKPEMLKTITQTLAAGLSGDELRQRALAPEEEPAGTTGAVAVLRLRGVITPFGSFLSLLFGGGPGGLVGFQASLQEAISDPEISAIVLEVDSPGGIVDLVPETAAMIREARAQKPIVAVANTMAASAAYWLASQADELIVTPSGMIGSIGVFVMHEDISQALEAEGIDVTFVAAGKYKTEANPFEPLSEEAQAHLQERVDEIYSMFVADVALGRDASEADVRQGFGEGRVVGGERAVELGMADTVATLEETIARVAAENASGTSGQRSQARPIGRVASRERAKAALATLHSELEQERERPPVDVPVIGLLRGLRLGAELAGAGQDQDEQRPHLVGHFATFNEWYEVNSLLEGHFLERITLGAFAKTFQEQRDRLRAIFDHGLDPQIGLKPLGPIDQLFEEADGAFYDVELIDTFYNRELIPGIEAGLYGASFRFRVIKEEFDPRPGRSAHNPHALPERTIKEVLVREFGPAPFPISQGPTASLRSLSLTDHFASKYAARHRDADEASAQALIGALAIPSLSKHTTIPARLEQNAETRSHFGNGRRDSQPLYGLDAQKEKPSWHL